PRFIDALKGVAASYGALGRSAQSRASWEHVARLAPEDAEAAAVLARFEAADDAAAEAEAAAEAAATAQEAAELEAAEAAAAQREAEVNAPPINIDPPVAQAPLEGQIIADEPADEEPDEEEPVVEEPEEEEAVVEEPDEPDEPVEPDDEQAEVDEEVDPAEEPAQAAGGPTIELLDTTLTARAADAGGEGAFNFLDAPAAVIGNLDEPYDYSQGTLHVRVEVLDKPTDDPILMQICLVPDDLITVSPACSEASRVRLDKEGVVTASQNVGALEGAGAIDWSQGMSQLLVVLRDTEGRPLDSRYAFDENGAPLNVEAYYPLNLRVRAALVPAGGAFVGW
ncbi:MAG TPA: hypothetical protein VFD39_03200, partial [Trueperaceae bacterium]|nr:hypothetical protein [Trueperaceae bacterium]